MDDFQSLAHEQFCYLTTVGRKSGNPHTVEIWFAARAGGNSLYILAGGGYEADWVKNIQKSADSRVRVANQEFSARGRIVTDPKEERLARQLVVAKYYRREQVNSSGWEAEALPVALDLETK